MTLGSWVNMLPLGLSHTEYFFSCHVTLTYWATTTAFLSQCQAFVFFLVCSIFYNDSQTVFRLIKSFIYSFIQQTHIESPSQGSCVQICLFERGNVYWSFIFGSLFSCFHWFDRQFMMVEENWERERSRKRCGLACVNITE